jgi:glycosyltransferase involved in cell wall biosynthesis
MISGFAKYAGGLEIVVNELTSFLVSRKAKVTVFGMYNRDFTETSQNCKTVGVRPYEILPPWLRFAYYDKYSYSLKVWRKIRREGPFDIIHGHGDNCFFPSLLRGGSPFIMTFHGTKKGGFYRVYGSKINPRSFPLFYPDKVAAERCDLAIACSKAVKDELITLYGVNPAKIKVIYNGVNTNKFRPINKKKARKMLGLPENKNYAIWVGTNPKLKGLLTAIKAVKGLKNTCLLVVGIPGANFENIIFWGKVHDYQLLCTLYNAADFLIFPTLYEGFPLTVLEAMACGIPVIVSKYAPIIELFNKPLTDLVVTNNDFLAYKEKVEWLMQNAEKHEDISTRCREFALNLSWEKQAGQYWKIYKMLAIERN